MTTFHTINGQILYQVDASGNRTEYVQDALGSVIATTDANRNVQNTYRYAPYGTQIASTGSSPAPMFLWNGTSGYRVTGRSHIGFYVRGRHYGFEEGSWSTTDHLWRLFGAYSYAQGRAVLMSDPTGFQPTVTRKQIGPSYPGGCCGGFDLYWTFNFSPDTFTGYLIQQVTITTDITCCDPQKTPANLNGCSYDKPQKVGPSAPTVCGAYYEGWIVVKGKALWPSLTECNGAILNLKEIQYWSDHKNTDWDDHWFYHGFPPCSQGPTNAYKMAGTLYLTTTPPSKASSWICVNCSDVLPSNCGTWDGSGGQAQATATYKYQCCVPPASGQQDQSCTGTTGTLDVSS